RAGNDLVLRRVAGSFLNARWVPLSVGRSCGPSLSHSCPVPGCCLYHQGSVLYFFAAHDSLDVTALPLRPVDEPWLERSIALVFAECHGHGFGDSAWPVR